jgi:rRNA maturation protein Nop10
VHPGLANAPALGGVTPETRVRDVIANGHDACNRGMFPEGGVLRGQVPPCGGESHYAAPVSFAPDPLLGQTRRLSGRRSIPFCPLLADLIPSADLQAALAAPSPRALWAGCDWLPGQGLSSAP